MPGNRLKVLKFYSYPAGNKTHFPPRDSEPKFPGRTVAWARVGGGSHDGYNEGDFLPSHHPPPLRGSTLPTGRRKPRVERRRRVIYRRVRQPRYDAVRIRSSRVLAWVIYFEIKCLQNTGFAFLAGAKWDVCLLLLFTWFNDDVPTYLSLSLSLSLYFSFPPSHSLFLTAVHGVINPNLWNEIWSVFYTPDTRVAAARTRTAMV